MDEAVRFATKWVGIVMAVFTVGLLLVIKFTTDTVEILLAITLVLWLAVTILKYFWEDIQDGMDWMWGDRHESNN